MLHGTTCPDKIGTYRHSWEKHDLGKFCLIIVSIIIVFLNNQTQGGTWTKKTTIPTPRVGSSACVINDTIYVLGGINTVYTDLAANEAYDPITNTWEVKQPMQTPRGFLSSAVVNGIIYAIGGGYPTATKKLEAYNPATNTWAEKADLLGNRLGAQAGVIDGIIYNIGGNYSQRNCEAYNPSTNTWTSKTAMPGAGGVVSVTVYNGLIYVFGGGYYGSFRSVYVYYPLTDTWTQKQNMPTPRFAFQTYLVNGKIYAIGGSQGEGNTLATVEVYDPVNDTWETKPNMPFKSSWFAGTVVNGKIYVIGGTPDWSTGGNEIWEYDPDAPFSCSPNVINFGNILVGTSSNTTSVTIENTGLQSFNITSITHNQNEFFLLNLPSFPITLEPLASIQFGVFFHPNNHGKINDEVIVSMDNTEYSTLTIPLEGLGILFGPQFQLFVDRINSAPYQERTAIVDSFLTEHSVMPFIEQDSICLFVYRGNVTNVCVAGDANGWSIDGSPMTALSSTNLRYYSDVYEPDARLDYKFVLNGSNWILDPMNPRTSTGGYGPNSELAMPEYVQPTEIEYYPNIPHGTIQTFSFSSDILGNSRTIKVYTPPDYDSYPENYYPVLLFHDGLEYITLGSANNIIDYLLSEGRINPIIAVFVPPVNRDDEYAFNLTQQYESFIVDELMPHIDVTYRTLLDPEFRAMVGLSFGGLLTTQICYNRPESFGLAAPYSPSYWVKNKEVFNSVLGGLKKDIKWYIDWGTYEPDITINARLFKDGLEGREYEKEWNEWHEAHSWGSWRAHLDNALEFFFPGSVVNVKEKQLSLRTFVLMQNYPNPFNPTTTIGFGIMEKENVRISILNILGEEIKILLNEEKEAGYHSINFNASDLPSGVYFYQLRANNFVETKKMLLLK